MPKRIVRNHNESKSEDIIERISANYIGDYAIRVSFNDGTEKLVDFKSFLLKSLHPSISKYRDETYLNNLKYVMAI